MCPVIFGSINIKHLKILNSFVHKIFLLRLLQDGEMVLLDGGCEYFGYVSDITRTWPVNGR